MEEKEWLAVLCQAKESSDWKMNQFLLAQDNLYRKIPTEQQERLIKQAIQCGREAAAAFSQPLLVYVEAQQIKVELFRESTKANQFNFVLAEFQLPQQVRLNQFFIEQGESLIKQYPELSFFTETASFQEILLAHELFHYIEHQQSLFTMQRQLQYQTGPFKRHARIYALSEIAASAFVQTLLSLSFHPLWLNPLLLYPVDPTFSQKLLAELQGVTAYD